MILVFFFSSRRRHTRCALVTGVQTCALPISVILTDLIENFEPARVRSRLFRWLVRLAGVAHPAGGTPADMRLTFWPRRRAVRAAMTEILAWDCERVVMAHGLPYEQGGAAELRRAFGWAV